MTVKDIIIEWLKANKYDGLCLPDHDCGCFLCDLMPCDNSPYRCVPGHQVMSDDGDWIIVASLDCPKPTDKERLDFVTRHPGQIGLKPEWTWTIGNRINEFLDIRKLIDAKMKTKMDPKIET